MGLALVKLLYMDGVPRLILHMFLPCTLSPSDPN